jgi:uncharacterized protein
MVTLDRHYIAAAEEHFSELRQMLFLSGPRQVGKTTMATALCQRRQRALSLNWDRQGEREHILRGPDHVAQLAGAEHLRAERPMLALDEIHKYGRWKTFLKGLFDGHADALQILVTGSAHMDVFRRGGDSLMGRYFRYRVHPLSVSELVHEPDPAQVVRREPQRIDDARFEALERFGGFPEPFLRDDLRFWRRWRGLRTEQLFREDLRDLTRIQELGQVEALAEVVRRQVGGLTSYTSLANAIQASVDSVRRWLGALEALYYLFPVRPWSRNIARALRKEPKLFLWDWSQVQDPGARAENMIASGLLKAVHSWSDAGHGDFGLYFVRDKQKHEVDFLVTRDDEPWFLVEVKRSGRAPLSKSLERFQRQTGARHAFQVALDEPFVARDCFEHEAPIIVPARTLLAQLV